MTQRLIQEWLPIAEIGEECKSECALAIALPPIYYLHLWQGKPLMTWQHMPQLILISV